MTSKKDDGERVAVIVGGTGAVGREILSRLIESSEFDSIHSFGRSAPSVTSKKLQHHEIDFSTLSTSPSIQQEISSLNANSVFVALGTTLAAAGSSEKFIQVDKDYVIEFAKAAKSSTDIQQQILYCSSAGANSKSMFLYPQSKGLTEQCIAAIGYAETIIFRPAILEIPGGRPSTSLKETFVRPIVSVLNKFTDTTGIPTPILGKAFVNASNLGVAALVERGHGVWTETEKGRFLLVNNVECKKLANKE